MMEADQNFGETIIQTLKSLIYQSLKFSQQKSLNMLTDTLKTLVKKNWERDEM